jgi:hypothetical protein
MNQEPDMIQLLFASLIALWHGAAVVEVGRSPREPRAKLKWILAVNLLMPFGLIAWRVRGGERRAMEYLGVTGY